ncbi:polysaccharide deacetylase family protein [Sphingobacterium rhinopitheci]|uniref:polysaccharide deacetylase family protein n=1 Tax=Sphingobacterium rhinopitheci TaxID=2781960 RepID=UPI001F52A881|nr:polysaccharide deacetylase family protein [Sphingobacterium rhinopitheci]MCI0921267.1 polysaccharide deacetylase family protein [Sphingobacterium rhinopitheci]
MYFISAPFFLRWYYPQVTWNKPRTDKKIYLTFDDGPIPEITPWILETLAAYNAKATFFCVGENIIKYPEIFENLKRHGHQIGNHTYSHLKGWNCSDQEYIANVFKCNELTKTKLFRPPYARAKQSQIARLAKDYDLIYWDVLSGDFDLKITPEKCLNNVLKHTKNGSIIVFHDNIKAIPRVQYALPKVLAHYTKLGYTFEVL